MDIENIIIDYLDCSISEICECFEKMHHTLFEWTKPISFSVRGKNA